MEYSKKRLFSVQAPLNAKEVDRELKKIKVLTPENIVKEASDEDSPLHKYFEWDDSKAAHEYRLQQARHLVLSIAYIDDEGESWRQYQSVVVSDQRQYLPIDKIAQSQSLVEQVLKEALDEAVYWKQKHQRYSKFFGGIFGEINKAEKTYRRKYGQEEESRSGGKPRRKNSNSTDSEKNSSRNHNRRVAANG